MTHRQRFWISFLALCALNALQTSAQEFSLCVSGRTSSNVSGVNRPYFDYWIKPKPDATLAAIRIFDAAISPRTSDVIYGKIDTRVTYELFRFADLYALSDKKLSPNPSGAKPIASLSVLDEERYRNRWEFFSQVAPDSMGYILRVSASSGNDVNAFKLVVSELAESAAQSEKWDLIGIDLSIGAINLPPNQEIQLKPYFEDEPPTALSVEGEEGALIRFKDDFGNEGALSEPQSFWKPIVSGERNHWGLSISRSRRYNFFTVLGAKEPVLWDLRANISAIPSPPSVSISQSPGGACDEVRFSVSDKTLARRFGKDFVWVAKLPGGDKRATGDTATIAFGKSGVYEAELWIPTQGVYFPKRWVKPFTARVNAPPVAKISVDKRIVAPNEAALFSAENSFDPDGDKLRYEWFVDGAIRGSSKQFRFSSASPNRYAVVLRVIDDATNSPCVSATDTAFIVVNSQPYAEIDFPPEFAVEETVAFKAKNARDNDGDSLRYEWSGAGVASDRTKDSVAVLHERHGAYSVSLRVSDASGVANASYQTSATYRVNAPPVPRFSLPALAAPGDAIRLSAAASTDADDRALSYSWDVSDGQSFDTRDATIQFASPGDYTVTLTVDDGHGVSNSSQSLSREIHVNFPPVPKIDAVSQSTVARQTFSARGTTDGDDSTLRYLWDFGDGAKAEGVEVTHTFQKSGRYVVTLAVDDGRKQTNSVQKTTHQFRLFRYPTARFNAPALAEPNKPIFLDGRDSFAPDGKLVSFKWFVDGKEVAEGDTASVVIAESGEHDIRLVVKDDSGFEESQSAFTKRIRLNYAPTPKFSLSASVVAPNQPVTLDASRSFDKDGKIKQHLWRFADGSSASGAIVTKRFSTTGVQPFTLTVDDGQGFENSKQSIQGQILVNSAPIIVTETTIRSNSRRVLLDASKSYDIDKHALSFEWIFPDGSKQNGATFFWDAPSDGVHFITLTADDGQNVANSKTRETIKVLVNRPPVAVVDSLVEACTGQTILFNGSRSYDPDGDALKFFWDFGDGATSTETDPAHSYSKPGQYAVTLKLDDGFVKEPTMAIIPVFIGGSPLAIPSFKDTTVCVQAPIAFDASRSVNPVGAIGSYAWDFGDGETALGKIVQHSYSKPGVYSVALTVVGSEGVAKRGKCSNVSQSSAIVRVVAGPIAEFSAQTWVAAGDTVVFDASASTASDRIVSYEWQIQADTLQQGDGETFARSGARTSHVFRKPGVYPVSLSIATDSKTSCRSASVTKHVRVNAPPVLVANVPKAVAVGERFLMDASQSRDPDGIVVKYEWKADGKIIGTTPKIAHVFHQSGAHRVELAIVDDSPTRSNMVSQVFDVFANAAPKPEIVLPSPIYENELVALVPKPVQDADGDALRFSWLIDGKPHAADTIRFLAGRHVVQLNADDGRALSNSRDSVIKEISVIPSPPFPSSLPKHVVQGATIEMRKPFETHAIGFVNGNSIEPIFQATTLGRNEVKLGWKPRDAILKTETFEMTVWEALKFVENPKPISLVWNPANPTTILAAPPVNRPDERKVIYAWSQGKRVLGYGRTLEVPLRKGENVFVVEASEEGVEGATPVSTQIVVKTE
ncbi:MAG: PKD domain-containing protein [Chloroherpetonaceae bacterium]|nr:PKD domain-containing protein [Chloroherpetonaceae bacterium]MDW8437142.1 PKD domain-containing protein [Chloroherpetonaceae bacterium]